MEIREKSRESLKSKQWVEPLTEVRRLREKQLKDRGIKNSILHMVNLRCLLDSQDEPANRLSDTWVWHLGEKLELKTSTW